MKHSAKHLLTKLQKQTGTTRSEAITVLCIALALAFGTVGQWVFSRPSLHEVASADRVLALIDSMQQARKSSLLPVDADSSYAKSNEADAWRASHRRGHRSSAAQALSGIRPVDLNTATLVQLEAVPGIGPATAEAILKRRTTRRFRAVEDLLDIKGIGPKKLEKMRAFIICKPP